MAQSAPKGPGWVNSSHLDLLLKQQETDAARHIKNLCSLSRAAAMLYVDDTFPANAQSLYGDRRSAAARFMGKGLSGPNYEWKRPHQLGSGWTVIGNSIEAQDIIQGELGDCWFLSALSVLAERPHLIDRILLTKQYNPEGAYAVRFFRDGDWKRVIVDDFFPTKYNQLAYGHCSGRHLWVSIIEKAYAKLHGSYAAIVAGQAFNALFDLTGAPCESISLEKDGVDLEMLWGRLLSFKQSNFLMAAACCRQGASEQYLEQAGLIINHAYSLVNVWAEAGYKLVKLRNPWGRVEWKGDWGRQSKQWTPEWKKKLNYYEEAGTFWMAYSDFVVHFATVDVCKEQASWYSLSVPAKFTDAASVMPTQMFELNAVAATWLFVMLIQNSNSDRSVTNFHDLGMIVTEAGRGIDNVDAQRHVGQIWPTLSQVCLVDFLTSRDKGTYLLLPFSAGPRSSGFSYTFAIYSANPVALRPLAYNPTPLRRHLPIAASGGRTEQIHPGVFLHMLHEGSSIFVVAVNRTESDYVYFEVDCSGSKNINSSRNRMVVRDVLNPGCRQLLMILTQQPGTMSYVWNSKYSVIKMNYVQLKMQNYATHDPPLKGSTDLHEPQPIATARIR